MPRGRKRGSSHRRRQSPVRRGSRWRQRSQSRHGPDDATLDLLEDLLHLWCRRRRAVNGAVGIAVVSPAKTTARNHSVSKARAMGSPVERRARDAHGTYIRSDLPPVDDCMRRAWWFINSIISFDEATPSASPPSTKPHLAVVGSNTDAPAMVFWAVALAGMAFSQSVYDGGGPKCVFVPQSCESDYDHHYLRQSVSPLFHGPAPRSPLRRLSVRLRRYRSNTSTESTAALGGRWGRACRSAAIQLFCLRGVFFRRRLPGALRRAYTQYTGARARRERFITEQATNNWWEGPPEVRVGEFYTHSTRGDISSRICTVPTTAPTGHAVLQSMGPCT